jgi:hypothetical protein
VNREPALADAIAKAVAASRVRTVRVRPDLLAAAAAVDRTGSVAVGWRARILAALEDLASAGVLKLSKTKEGNPALPKFVTRRAEERPSPEPVVPIIWHADLEWVVELEESGKLGLADRRVLAAVNAWLPRRRGFPVPMRERSLEIFGDEKALETITLGPLFGPDRLSLAHLECWVCWPPVEQTHLGPGDWLVIENYTTYVSISRRAKELDFPGRIVWGSGTQVGTRLTALAASGTHPPPNCWYFGDLDSGGFQAAHLAVRRAAELGLGPVLPARGLYRLALTNGHPRGSRALAETAQWAQVWLGGPLGIEIGALIGAGQRIVQEHVGLELLAHTDLTTWFDDPS